MKQVFEKCVADTRAEDARRVGPTRISTGSHPDVLDRLMGTDLVRKPVESGSLGALFQSWIDAHDEFESTKVCLY